MSTQLKKLQQELFDSLYHLEISATNIPYESERINMTNSWDFQYKEELAQLNRMLMEEQELEASKLQSKGFLDWLNV